MNRRRFMELMGMAAAASGIVYSFPSVIVPKNIERGFTMLDVVPDPPAFPISYGQTHWRVYASNGFCAWPDEPRAYYTIPVTVDQDGMVVVPSFQVRSAI